ncbi:MAG: sulfotransferase [Myxococcota bacterium]|nr:sulfotransferase [Myxococcota bacterium]
MSVWQPGPRPDWVQALHEVSDPSWIRLDADELLAEAEQRTGLSDFGGDDFQEPYRVFVTSLVEEAQLHTLGRLIARDDLLNWLGNRLELTEWRKRHPEIAEQAVSAPVFITGLPRTGTSILHELLAQDPAHRAPLHWEVRHPCPPPQVATYRSDERIARADRQIRLWNRIVPEYDTMHELGGEIPVECIQLTAHSFRSDELMGRHLVPSYGAWFSQCDLVPAYAFHRRMLQHLQWRCPAERWVLKAPSHLGQLEALLAVYPDARIVFTHRDPLRVLPSVASILYSTAWVRSDAVDPDAVLDWFTGETCAYLLNGMTELRDSGLLRPEQCVDVRYAELIGEPAKTLAGIYDHFEIPYSAEAERRMRDYLEAKPKGRHGEHQYSFADTGLDLATEHERFQAYYERYGVPAET